MLKLGYLSGSYVSWLNYFSVLCVLALWSVPHFPLRYLLFERCDAVLYCGSLGASRYQSFSSMKSDKRSTRLSAW